MFKQWLQYGDTEIVNLSRTLAYVGNGLAPVGAYPPSCVACDNLRESLGDQEYTSPIVDDAPWYSSAQQGSQDFAGLAVVDITGLEGSTTTVEVTEKLGDGGLPGGRRATSRTIAVTADLFGRTPESVNAGLAWLTAALHPPCVSTGCRGDTLHLLTDCPEVCEGNVDPESVPETITLDQVQMLASDNCASFTTDTSCWTASQGAVIARDTARFHSTPASMHITWAGSGAHGTVSTTLGPTVFTPGLRYRFWAWCYVPTGSPDAHLGISGQADVLAHPITVRDQWVLMSVTWTATAEAHTLTFETSDNAATGSLWVDDVHVEMVDSYLDWQSGLRGPDRPGVCDPITITWTLGNNGTNPITAKPRIRSAIDATLLYEADPFQIPTGGSPGTFTYTWEEGTDQTWYTTLEEIGPTASLQVQSLAITSREALTLDACVSPYRRTYRNVVTASGPSVVERLSLGDYDDDSTAWRVEWTWVATNPFVYGDPIPIAMNVPSQGGNPSEVALGIEVSAPATIAALNCPLPAPDFVTCADDPGCLPMKAPPQAPVLTDPCVFVPTGYSRRTVSWPPERVPSALAVLSWQFVNDATAKKGVRIRIWEDPDPAPAVPVECDFIEEWFITYLGPSQTLTAMGRDQRVEIQCGIDPVTLQPILVDGIRNVRGKYGGPWNLITLGCGRRYFLTIDVPTGQGNLTWSMQMVQKEG